MKLIGNVYNDAREIEGFSKETLLEIKNILSKYQSEKATESTIIEYLKPKFSLEFFDPYSKYLEAIAIFWNIYINTKGIDLKDKDFYCYNLKLEILNEIKLINKNSLNLKVNGQNILRFVKNNAFLNDFLTKDKPVLETSEQLAMEIEKSLKKPEKPYDNIVYLWIEATKIKDPLFKLNKIPKSLEDWEEIKDIYGSIEKLDSSLTEKQKKKKKGQTLTFRFNDLYKLYAQKHAKKLDFFIDLLHLLYIEKVYEEAEDEGEFVNILERKEIIQDLKKLIRPIINTLIQDRLKDVLDEIVDLDKSLKLDDSVRNVNLSALFEQDIGDFMPKIVGYYFKGLEKKYQEVLNKIVDNLEEFKNIAHFYLEKIDILTIKIKELINIAARFNNPLKPYDEISNSLKKVFSTLLNEIERRKDEYLGYLETIKAERLRDIVRNYVSEKITEANNLITAYQDETSLIIREEFPQLKQVREIIKNYKEKITNLKDEMYKRLEAYKEKDIEIYQIIKLWEDNFNRKNQQLSFLLSLLLNKLYKNFKELLEEEGLIFDNISEIKSQDSSAETLPLNFALSDFLVDKLNEKELNERITEVNAKTTKLNDELNLYKNELTKLEKTLISKVKLREGIETDNVQCTVCHKKLDFAKDKIISCPFCGAIYHYLCVAFWLSKYNSCPSCQNQFLDPNSGMFEDQGEPYDDEEET